jgi:hypothetical protein
LSIGLLSLAGGTFVFGSPIPHFVHKEWERGWRSLAIRVAGVLVAVALGVVASVDCADESEDSGLCVGPYFIGSGIAVTGAISTASIVDGITSRTP